MKKVMFIVAVLLFASLQSKCSAAMLDFSFRTSQNQVSGMYAVDFYVDSVNDAKWKKGKIALEFNQRYFKLASYDMNDSLDIGWKSFANPKYSKNNGLLCFNVEADKNLDTSNEVLLGTFVFESKNVQGWADSFLFLKNNAGFLGAYKTKFRGFNLKDDVTRGNNHSKELDSIQISTAHLPEPSVLAILGLGGMFLSRFRKR